MSDKPKNKASRRTKKGGGLNEKQAQFVKEYLVDLNATQAAIRAGYSAKTAGWIGQQLLTKTHIAEAVRLEMEARSQRTEITADRVLAEYAKLAFLDPRRFYDDKGCLIPIHELPADTAACIAGMDVSTERVGKDADGSAEFATVRKIKLVDKKGALDSVARHLGMFNDKLNLSGSLEQRVREMTSEEIQAELAALRAKRNA
ncbi:terminase small subunit [Solidesulfovibrio sp.]